MATTLPAISASAGGRMNPSPSIQQHRGIVSPGKTPTSTKSYLKQARKPQSRKDVEILRKQELLRARQAPLNVRDTSTYRNTFMHNLCLDMLQEGYHNSYSELFSLVKQQHTDRKMAGPESILWNAAMLDEEYEKLETLKVFLTQAEAADRKGDHAQVYESRYELARYFQGTGDKWLSDHFFTSCLQTSQSVQGDGRHQAEAHCNVGLAFEDSDEFYEAAEQFESFHAMAKEKLEWKNSDNHTLFSVACEHLSRVYTTISKKIESQDTEGSLNYLSQAYEMAKASEDKHLEGKAAYILGKAYSKQKEAFTALKHLNSYMEICRELGDNEGLGQACEAIAKAYQSQGRIQDSIRYLQMYCDVAEKSKQEKEYSRACSALGGMYNSLGQYGKAVDYFGKSYNLSRAMNDTQSISTSRVQFGMAQAHHMMTGISEHIELGSRPCLQRLGEWKSNRKDEFSKEIQSEDQTETQEANETEKPDEDAAETTDKPQAEVQAVEAEVQAVEAEVQAVNMQPQGEPTPQDNEDVEQAKEVEPESS